MLKSILLHQTIYSIKWRLKASNHSGTFLYFRFAEVAHSQMCRPTKWIFWKLQPFKLSQEIQNWSTKSHCVDFFTAHNTHAYLFLTSLCISKYFHPIKCEHYLKTLARIIHTQLVVQCQIRIIYTPSPKHSNHYTRSPPFSRFKLHAYYPSFQKTLFISEYWNWTKKWKQTLKIVLLCHFGNLWNL